MKHTINLLSKKEKTVFDKTVYFFLNYLRYILVITQLIVLGVLFFRFRVDENITELRESVKQKQEILRVVKPLLSHAKTVEIQLNAVETSISSQVRHKQMVEYVFLAFPSDLYIKNATLSEKNISVEGETQSPQQLQKYVKFLKDGSRFKDITIENLKKNNTTYTFKLNMTGFNTI